MAVSSSPALIGLVVIKYFTGSPFSHVGIILKDPIYFDQKLVGIYLWESGMETEVDPQDNLNKIGVRITKLEDVFKGFTGDIYLRKLTNYELIIKDKLIEIHKQVYKKPYDLNPIDWFEALIKKDNKPQKTSRFWCSAFVGYVYTKLGILKEDTDWSIMRPSDFSIKKEHLQYITNTKLDKQVTLITEKSV